MAVVDTGDIIKVDFQDGDSFGNSYSDGWNRYRVWEAINDETIMKKEGNIYTLYNRALHIGTENPDTYFFDDAGGTLIWQGSVDELYIFKNNGYTKIYDCSLLDEIGEYLDNRSTQECLFENCNLYFVKWIRIKNTSFINSKINCDLIEDNGNNVIDVVQNGNGVIGLAIQGSSDITKYVIHNFTYGIKCDTRLFDGTAYLENVEIIDCDYDIRYIIRDDSATYYVINSKIDITSEEITVVTNDNYYINLQLQNRFQIYITNGSGASATLKDKDGNTIKTGTLDSEGKWLLDDPVTWVQRYLETADGELVKNELNYKEPFSLEVKKNGLQDLTIPNIYSSIYDKNKGKRIGSLEDTVVEGAMREKNYVDMRLSATIEETEINAEVEAQTEITAEII